MMKRREFLNKSLQAGLWCAVAPVFTAGTASVENEPVAAMVKGQHVEAALESGLGLLGVVERFVTRGKRVVIKPAIARNRFPEAGMTTDPSLVAQLVKRCYQAGAREVAVFDHTLESWTKCYKNSGIERVVKDAGGRMVPANDLRYFEKVSNPQAQLLPSVLLHRSLLSADLFINMPVVTRHHRLGMAAAIANLTGCVWDRGVFSREGAERCLAELLYYCNPTLTISDAWLLPENAENNPVGETHQTLLFSTQIVAADVMAAPLAGIEPRQVQHLRLAAALGFGKLEISSPQRVTVTL